MYAVSGDSPAVVAPTILFESCYRPRTPRYPSHCESQGNSGSVQSKYRRQLRGYCRGKGTYRTNSWRFDFQVVADIAAVADGELACDADYPANDSMIRGGEGLTLEDQEDHFGASSWVFGGEEKYLEEGCWLCMQLMLLSLILIVETLLHGGRSHRIRQ